MSNTDNTTAIRKLRCPRCGRPPRALIEISTVETTFHVTDDGHARESDGYHESGLPFRVIAKCERGHRWRPRRSNGARVLQITDLDATAC
jgi:hypothetical protein